MRKNFSRQHYIAALDIGTSKICCALGRPSEKEGEIQIFGLGHHQSRGVKNGQIVNLESVSHAVTKAIHAAEQMARQPIQEVFVNISGKATSIRPDITEKIGGREIEEIDVHNLLEKAKEVHEGQVRQELLHSLPVYYTVDETPNILNPVGMYADNLGVKVHVISTQETRAKHLVQALDKAHVDVQHIVYTPYASGLGTLLSDEMDLGAAVIDFGAGTTSLSVFKAGQCLFAICLPIGGLHITNDIAHALSTPIEQAERIKILYGSALMMPSDKKARLKIPQLTPDQEDHEQTITKYDLNSVIQPRLEEIFDLLLDALKKHPEVQAAARRFVLTGGGSQLLNLKKYAAKRLDQQVRFGAPIDVLGLTEASGGPGFSVCAGLLHYGNMAIKSGHVTASNSWFDRMVRWFKS